MTFNAESLINPTLKALPPSGIRKFFDLASEVKDIISLGVGEPDFVTPWHIREACLYSLERGFTMYTSNHGLPDLRREITLYLQRRFGLDYDPTGEVLVTVGASEAVDLALRAVISSGDEVLVPEPCYVSYKPCVAMAGGVPRVVNTYRSNDFKLCPQDLEKAITPRTKAVIFCYPNNPTGAVMTREELQAVAEVVERHNLLVITDDIYCELRYDGRHASFASLPGMQERTILINGLSKSFAMTGWRIGYACAHRALIAAMVKLHQYTILCAPVMGQMAALEALRSGEGEMTKMVTQYNQRRRLLVKSLNELGMDCFEPQGAFYVFPSIRITGLGSEEFCERLLKEEKVAVVPGNAFGEAGEGHIRISYAAALEDLQEALRRMGNFLEPYAK